MKKPYLRDLQADAIDLLKERGGWVIAGVETHIAWPKTPQVVPFGGNEFILRPLTSEDAATVCLNAAKAGVSPKDARDLILRFGSALSWTEGHAFEVTTWAGGSHAIRLGRRRGNTVQDFLDPELLPKIQDEDAATALAFYRAGLSSDNNFYAFLSLYKAIAYLHRDGKQRGEWIEKTLPILKESLVKKRLQELVSDGIKPSEYLRDHGRHAIAHAEKDVFVNPDKVVDHERVYRDLPIMGALARKAIEERFDLYSRLSRSAPDASDIPGFERIFGPERIEKILSNEDCNQVGIVVSDDITVLVRRANQVIFFHGFRIDAIHPWEHGVGMRLMNREGSLSLDMGIDFRRRRLVYEPQGSSRVSLNRASRSSLVQYQKLQEFNWLYIGNGRLELWDAETDDLLGKSETYIPLNMFLDHEAVEKARAETRQLLDTATDG